MDTESIYCQRGTHKNREYFIRGSKFQGILGRDARGIYYAEIAGPLGKVTQWDQFPEKAISKAVKFIATHHMGVQL